MGSCVLIKDMGDLSELTRVFGQRLVSLVTIEMVGADIMSLQIDHTKITTLCVEI